MTSSSTATTINDSDPCKRWSTLSDDELTTSLVAHCLEHVADDLWVAAACTERVVEDATVQRSLLELGLKRTDSAAQRCRSIYENEDFDVPAIKAHTLRLAKVIIRAQRSTTQEAKS